MIGIEKTRTRHQQNFQNQRSSELCKNTFETGSQMHANQKSSMGYSMSDITNNFDFSNFSFEMIVQLQ